MLNFITGGVCAAQGFRAGGIHVGVKTHAAWKKDVALIVSDEDCACAAVYTKNAVKAPTSMWTSAIWRTERPGLPLSTAATPTPAPLWERKTRSGSARRQARPWVAGRRMWW